MVRRSQLTLLSFLVFDGPTPPRTHYRSPARRRMGGRCCAGKLRLSRGRPGRDQPDFEVARGGSYWSRRRNGTADHS